VIPWLPCWPLYCRIAPTCASMLWSSKTHSRLLCVPAPFRKLLPVPLVVRKHAVSIAAIGERSRMWPGQPLVSNSSSTCEDFSVRPQTAHVAFLPSACQHWCGPGHSAPLGSATTGDWPTGGATIHSSAKHVSSQRCASACTSMCIRHAPLHLRVAPVRLGSRLVYHLLYVGICGP
jgi:hypothetical protein